jgi:hypothetical protein
MGAVAVCVSKALPAFGHVASPGFLDIRAGESELNADVYMAIRDLDDLMGLDANADGFVVWGEVKARESDLFRYVRERVRFSADGKEWSGSQAQLMADQRPEGNYAVFRFAGALSPASRLRVDYSAFAERDPLHRSLAKFSGGKEDQTAVLGAAFPSCEFDLEGSGDRASSFVGFLREGVHHIWTGYDHLAFLFALLLPAVLKRSEAGWVPVASFRIAATQILKIVTAFTAAHSVTLALAAFEVVRLPGRLVEASIAASILVAVAGNFRSKAGTAGDSPTGFLNGLLRIWRENPAAVAFFFGLIHGFGFAGVLGEMGLKGGGIAVPLVAFNAGVEAGQVACVLLFLPVAFALRSTVFYRRWFMPAGSALIALLACAWMTDRVGNFGFMPF